MSIKPLTPEQLEIAVQTLIAQDERLAYVWQRLGTPPMWAREPGFGTLIHIILEQQVSLASALAAFNRLQAALPELTPSTFLTLNDDELKTIGFSRQKTRYCRLVADAILSGELDLDGLGELDDVGVSAELTKITGIGNWTANVYLLMVLLRPDAWATGDRALAVAVQELYGMPKCPTYPELDAFAERWQPHRATAARLLWHFYLNRKNL